MAIPPYLIFGFDVDPASPNAAAIVQDVEAGFPIHGIGSLGVDDTYFVEVPSSQAPARYREVAKYLDDKDQAWNGELRWFVQLCRSAELASG